MNIEEILRHNKTRRNHCEWRISKYRIFDGRCFVVILWLFLSCLLQQKGCVSSTGCSRCLTQNVDGLQMFPTAHSPWNSFCYSCNIETSLTLYIAKKLSIPEYVHCVPYKISDCYVEFCTDVDRILQIRQNWEKKHYASTYRSAIQEFSGKNWLWQDNTPYNMSRDRGDTEALIVTAAVVQKVHSSL